MWVWVCVTLIMFSGVYSLGRKASTSSSLRKLHQLYLREVISSMHEHCRSVLNVLTRWSFDYVLQNAPQIML